MPNPRLCLIAVAILLAFGVAIRQLDAQRNQKTQTLNLPRDPPLVAVGETSRLTFQVSPLSGKGLLSEQTRDALKAILKLNGNSPIIHLRAFSAGNGDIRRIPQIVSDELNNKPLPSVSVLQAGALTLDDAQVVLEAVSLGKKEVNKTGLAFHAAEAVLSDDPKATVQSLLQNSVDQLAAKMNGNAPLAVTCFVSSLDGVAELSQMISARFPGAAIDLVQPRRLAFRTEVSCEGVSRGGSTPTRIAFSGTQIAFGAEDKDAALAIQRLDRGLAEAGAAPAANAMLLHFYLPNPDTLPVVKKQVAGPAPTSPFIVEGVGPSAAGFALDAVSAVR
jgi:hypothetical protein